MSAIVNYDFYETEMQKSMKDKAFFVEKIDFDILVDFGCADGSLIQYLAPMMPNKIFIGYDNNPKMIEDAKSHNIKNAQFFSSFKKLKLVLENTNKKKALICNSLIHEIYSYCNQNETQDFWNNVFSGLFDYIIIRDMSLEDKAFKSKSSLADLMKIERNIKKSMIEDFENEWGSLKFQNNLVHFLMKYRYIDNWEREVEENYFPLKLEEYQKIIKAQDDYQIEMFEHFTLPFHKESIRKDFNIDFNEKTHVKIILKKVDKNK